MAGSSIDGSSWAHRSIAPSSGLPSYQPTYSAISASIGPLLGRFQRQPSELVAGLGQAVERGEDLDLERPQARVIRQRVDEVTEATGQAWQGTAQPLGPDPALGIDQPPHHSLRVRHATRCGDPPGSEAQVDEYGSDDELQQDGVQRTPEEQDDDRARHAGHKGQHQRGRNRTHCLRPFDGVRQEHRPPDRRQLPHWSRSWCGDDQQDADPGDDQCAHDDREPDVDDRTPATLTRVT